jgi:hypothetical protein
MCCARKIALSCAPSGSGGKIPCPALHIKVLIQIGVERKISPEQRQHFLDRLLQALWVARGTTQTYQEPEMSGDTVPGLSRSCTTILLFGGDENSLKDGDRGPVPMRPVLRFLVRLVIERATAFRSPGIGA